jgi:hypothetical protein
MNKKNSTDVVIEFPEMTFYNDSLPFLARTIEDALKSRGILVSANEIQIKVKTK